jgi:hypothetical protein
MEGLDNEFVNAQYALIKQKSATPTDALYAEIFAAMRAALAVPEKWTGATPMTEWEMRYMLDNPFGSSVIDIMLDAINTSDTMAHKFRLVKRDDMAARERHARNRVIMLQFICL